MDPDRETRGLRGRPLYLYAVASGRRRSLLQARRVDIGVERLEQRLAMAVLPVLTDPAQLTAAGSTLYFSAGDATGGQELWKTDGTETGTVRVKDIVPGVAGSKPKGLVAAGTSLTFQFDGRADGKGLWITDGTEAGTKSISDPWSRPTGYYLYRPVGRPILLFYSNILDPAPRPVGSAVSFTEYDSKADKFFLSQASAVGAVIRLRQVSAPVWTSFSGGGGFQPDRLVQAGARTLAASNTTLCYECDQGLWWSDGPGQGGTLVASLASLEVERIIDATTVGPAMFFTAAPKAAAGRGSGTDLWITDGTAAGTRRLRTEAQGTVTRLTAVGSTLFFLVDDATGLRLWRTDGTDAGTIPIKGVQPGATTEFAAVGDTLYFTATDAATGAELWRARSDSTTSELVGDVRPGSAGSAPASLTALGSMLYFTADDGSRGRVIWKTDGTSTGTVLVADLAPAAAGSSAASLTAAGQMLFFTAKNAAGGIELWKTDGTPTGLRRLSVAISPPTLRLGDHVEGGATLAEATQASGVVTVAGAAGQGISVAFVGTSAGAVDPQRVIFKKVTGAGTGTPVAVALTAAEVKALGEGLVYVNAVQVDAANNASVHASTSFKIDTIRPLATGESPIRPATIVAGAVIRFAVTFSENVFVKGTPFIGLTLDGGVSRRAEYVSGSGTKTLVFQYRIQPGDRAAKGPVMASSISPGGGSIADSAGNAAVLAIRPPSLTGLVIQPPRWAAFARP